MQITVKNSPAFGAIKLNDQEYKKAEIQLKSYNADNADLVNANLYDIFEKHIDKESKYKSRGIYYSDEIYQNLFVTLFENIENASKEINPVDFILKKLNTYWTTKDDVLPNHIKGQVSIDSPLNHDTKSTRQIFLTEDDLPVYASPASPELRITQQKEILNARSKTKLGSQANKYLDEYMSGKNYRKVSRDNNRNPIQAMRSIKSSVLKIKKSNNNLPEKYSILAQELKDEFNLKLPQEQILNYILIFPSVAEMSKEEFIDYARKASEGLEIDKNSIMASFIKTPGIFGYKPENLRTRAEKLAEVLNTDYNSIKPILKYRAQLLASNPEHLKTKFQNIAEILNMSFEELTSKKYLIVTFLYIKPESIEEKIQSGPEFYGISKDEFINAININPQFLLRNPKSIKAKLKFYEETLNISKEEVFKKAYILQLSTQKVIDNINFEMYCRKIQNKQSGKLSRLLTKEDKSSKCKRTLSNLLRQDYKNITQANIDDYIKTHPDNIYKLSIPEDELAQEFINLAEKYSHKLLGKNVFDITIKE